jgi:hypothetical protein
MTQKAVEAQEKSCQNYCGNREIENMAMFR